MTQIRFHVSESVIKSLTLEEYEAVERAQDGNVRMYLLRPLMARFVVDEKGEPLPTQLALNQLGRLTMEQAGEVIKGFFEAMKDTAIPKASGPSSPSESTQAAGSQSG
ncbi:MAG TPA: hypothetical protein PKC99_06170 [Anaerolineales bacterium]|nr:hypothetical protein [Bryobacterales bacterium]HMM98574.1 hypothetical protein [Anaerolineales bacterium]